MDQHKIYHMVFTNIIIFFIVEFKRDGIRYTIGSCKSESEFEKLIDKRNIAKEYYDKNKSFDGYFRFSTTDIKNMYAKEKGYINWNDMFENIPNSEINIHIDELMKLYLNESKIIS